VLVTLPSGAYTVFVSGVGGTTGVGLVEVFEPPGASADSRLTNISTRGLVETDANILIGGFIIEGTKTVLIRARGPSMGGAPFLVPGTLANPLLQLLAGQTVIASNDNWQDPPSCPGASCGGAADITATGSDPCQPNPGQADPPPGCTQESALLVTLPSGPYTVFVSGVGQPPTGVGLVEVFEP
jgi:hypothetical protein